MQANFEQKAFISLVGLKTENLPIKEIPLQDLSLSDYTYFWQLWEQYRDYLYSRCLQWMGGNRHDAEDLFSRAMLKAWNQWPDYKSRLNQALGLVEPTHPKPLHGFASRTQARGAKDQKL